MNQPLLVLSIFVLLISFAPSSLAAEENNPQPEAEFKSPDEGDEVDYTFTARGRTKNIPDGFVIMLFQVIPENDFLYPAAEPSDPNRTFSETIYHGEQEKEGPRTLELHMVPEEDAEALTEWREQYLEWFQKGQKGEMPAFDPSWMEKTEGITAVGYVLAK